MPEETRETEPDKKRELDFVTCPIHGIRYPRGGECPKCAAESQ